MNRKYEKRTKKMIVIVDTACFLVYNFIGKINNNLNYEIQEEVSASHLIAKELIG